MKDKKPIEDVLKDAHETYKDHEVVEKAEKWWKKKSFGFQAIFVIAVILVGYNWLVG